VVTAYTLAGPPRLWPSLPPIGRPIANAQIYLLDPNGQPVPSGAIGELYIGGEVLAYGYYDRPDLTAERFIPNPFNHKAGTRLYKTGDLARHLPDGSIQFLGRNDYQVKIRGFRIELGEVEAVLCQHPAVRDAVVLAWEPRPGDKRLAAYLVARPPADPPVQELREHLGAKLPDYMVPAAFIVLDRLPLTPNGKVDRKALPAPSAQPSGREVEYIAPRTPTEKALAGIWRQVLGMEQVGVHDNFFELGGHSLLAATAISLIRNTFHLEVAVRSFFQNPTVAGLAAEIDQFCLDDLQPDDLNQILAEIESVTEPPAETLAGQPGSSAT
jgi:hypothetical protein